MARQSVIWTALPNGMAGDGPARRLRLSVLVSPRLRPGAGEDHTLLAFPDFREWPSRVLAASFHVAFDGGPTIAAQAVGPSPEPIFWAALFKEDTLARPYVFDDHSQRQIVSYPVRRLLDTLRRPYRQIGLDSAERLPSGRVLLQMLDTFATEWNVDTEAIARQSLGQGQGIGTREALARLMLFHHPPELRPNDTQLPQTSEDFREVVDFHQAVSSLGDYPELMRRLGLVLDLEVPIGDLPDGAVPPNGLVRVLADWAATGPPPVNVSPSTVYRVDGTRFEATPLSQSIVGGILALQPGEYGVVQVDVDGGVIKVNNTALNLRRSSGTDIAPEVGLPSLRTGGVSLVRDGRAEQTGQRLTRSVGINSALDADPPQPVRLFAEDLVRGYRIDVWDSQTDAWHSLCRRIGTYQFVEAGIERTFEDEGWVQMGATAAPAPGKPPEADDLYLPESLFRWEGWSLVVHRPGKAISHSPDPAAPPVTPANDPVTPFKLVTSFRVPDRSLPRLRFGTGYRIRARVADLAGNGPSFDASSADGAVPPAPGEMPYLRFEPVGAPAVVLRSPLTMEATPGEALERLVIRAFNANEALDGLATPAISERHIAPPRSSQLQAEVHGRFDRPGGGLKIDALTYATIRDKDAGQFNVAPLNPLDPTSQVVPVEPDPRLTLPYLPDPLARGAALRDLPAVPDGTVSRVIDPGVLITEVLPGPEVRPGSATLIPFGDPTSWPDTSPFRLVLAEGNTPPTWDSIGRVLTIRLPRAAMAPVALSSFLDPEDLKLMGVWEWIREEVDERARTMALDPRALEDLSRLLGRVVERALEGGHWMLTPSRTLTLVHAVQQPLGHARFSSLTALRQQEGATAAILTGTLAVHGRSTIKVDLVADWKEPIDLLDEPAPREIEGHMTADEIPLADLSVGILRVPSRPQPIGMYEPEPVDEVRFNTDAHPRHEFGDTKHRMVHYRPVSTSRFREYFPPDVPGGFTRPGDEILVDVPSSARPDAPRVLYVLPTFGWQRQADTNLIASRRLGGGLRVYMDRGWFSSGADEMLGVVYSSTLRPDTLRTERERQSPFVTEWGFDPIHKSRPGTPALSSSHFPGSVGGFGLHLPELPGTTLSVAAYRPAFATDRSLWYCDLTIEAGDSYYPFVKLALARYQPHATAGVELSRVVLANIAQIAPDRSVIVTYDPYNRDLVHVVVAGFTYDQPDEARRMEIEVSGERQYDPERGELGWGFAPGVTVTSSLSSVSDTDRLLWHGQVRLPPGRASGEYRVMVKEYERYIGDGQPGVFPPIVRRLVYAEGLVV